MATDSPGSGGTETRARTAACIQLVRRGGATLLGGPLVIPRHPVRRSTVYGASLFGVAFGVGATCPGITVAMLATGGYWGGVVLAGIFAGLWLRGTVERSDVREPGRASRGRVHLD